MNSLRKCSVLLLLVASIFMTGCDATQIVDVINRVAQGVQQAAPAIQQAVQAVQGILGNNSNNNAAPNNNQAAAPAQQEAPAANPAAVTVNNPRDIEDIANAPSQPGTQNERPNNTTPITTVAPAPTAPAPVVTPTPATPATPALPVNISDAGRRQLAAVAEYALANNRGASNGQCFNAVWGYLTAVGYGNLKRWGDLPNMRSGEARYFAEFMNASQRNIDEAGLIRLDTALTPPINSPHDPRIPKGAVIVVGPGSTGTGHPTAGDIVIKAGEGRFVNDGPNMNYGTPSTWRGTILGVYIPR